jgi:hypothetical protein
VATGWGERNKGRGAKTRAPLRCDKDGERVECGISPVSSKSKVPRVLFKAAGRALHGPSECALLVAEPIRSQSESRKGRLH